MAFEAVIFDFGGVFTTSPIENFADFEARHELPDRFIGSIIKANIHANAWARFERGEIDLDTFDRLFAEESRLAGHEISGLTLISLLSLTFRPEMIEALARIKKAGLKTGCITNNLPGLDAATMLSASAARERLAEIYANFDHIIESSKAGMRKPELAIYQRMIDLLDVDAAACIFIDDLGVNLKPAAMLGMTTVKAPFGDITPAIDQLSELLSLKLR